MKNFRITLALAVALCISIVCPISATTSNPVAGVVRCTATADTVTGSNLPYGAKIVAVKVNGVTAGKYFRLRSGVTASGAIIYETNTAATTATLTADPVSFTFPGAGLYYQTDDASANANITIYTE